MCCCLIYSGKPFKIHSWSKASSGVIRFYGSHSKQRDIISVNDVSLLPTTYCSFIELMILYFPFSCGILHSNESLKNFFLLSAFFSIAFGGASKTYMNMRSCSFSLSPGKMGKPVKSSTKMHPKDHMSIAGVYLIPRMIYGAL